jgi:transcriptional regulator with XRE-family HTH domain
MPDALSDMSEALRWLRERIGLSRDQLAAASGVSAVYIKFIERGKRNPSEAVIQRLLPALRVTRADLDGLLRLRPWASSTASGAPATLASYAAGVPLAVDEGSEFELTQRHGLAQVADAGPDPHAGPPPEAAMAASPPTMARAASGASAPRRAAAGALASPAPALASPAPALASPAGALASPAGAPAPPTGPSPRPSHPEPQTLDAELIELRERYVHLTRSKQEMVLGWLRTLDDRDAPR